MIDQTLPNGRSPIHRLDPRARIVAASIFAVLVAVSGKFAVATAGLALGAALVVLARLPLRTLLGRLVAVNAFVAFLWLFLPFTTPGPALARLGPLTLTRAGLDHALLITLKCNAIVLATMALMATIELVRLGHALHHLRVPEKLVHLFLFTVRYVHVLHDEYRRLLNAMIVRGFRARPDLRTCRVMGNLAGMLLVRSFDRSDRVMAAMKCRGFRGRFWMLNHFHFGRRDLAFSALSLVVLGVLGWMQWTTVIR